MLGLGLSLGVRMYFLVRKGLIGFCVAFFVFENNDRMNICFGLGYLVHCLGLKVAERYPVPGPGQFGRVAKPGVAGPLENFGGVIVFAQTSPP